MNNGKSEVKNTAESNRSLPPPPALIEFMASGWLDVPRPSTSMTETEVRRRSISMIDWKTGAPNPRFRVLELLRSNLLPGDQIVSTKVDSQEIYALGFVSQKGEHKILLVNKRDSEIHVTIPQRAKHIQRVDTTTKAESAVKESVNRNALTLHPYAVMVVTLE